VDRRSLCVRRRPASGEDHHHGFEIAARRVTVFALDGRLAGGRPSAPVPGPMTVVARIDFTTRVPFSLELRVTSSTRGRPRWCWMT